MVHQKKFTIQTRGHRAMHDVTAAVNQIVEQSGIRTGIAHICNLGSTAAVGTIEYEPGLQKDLPDLLDRIIPPSREYGHEQTWQQVFLLECDIHPRERTIVVTVMGEEKLS